MERRSRPPKIRSCAIEEQDGVEIKNYTYDAETGEFKYTIKVTISKLAVASGSGSAKVSTAPLDA